MNSIAFIDTEIEPKSRKILDIGGIKNNDSFFHSNSIPDFVTFLNGTKFICGHNIWSHDLKYLQRPLGDAGILLNNVIDTLYFSPLLFPTQPYHKLLKDDKLQTDDLNNPLNDSIKAKDLFYDELAVFNELDALMKQIFFLLLSDKVHFQSFFKYAGFESEHANAEMLIRERFHSKICSNANLNDTIDKHPIELAYCLALINSTDKYSITPPWVLKNYPEVERILLLLRNKPCLAGCMYCDQALDIHKGLDRYFGFNSYRTYAGEPLQENAVKAAINHQSLLAVFPTGGGKSITFQVPALMSGENTKGLTIVISPLQSLMKDQVDNLEKNGITEAVTINGLLDPIERGKSFERVENGSAWLLYISPESLRSKTIEKLLLGRKIARFVIDEAHCFSSWGQDFRVDYLYIGDFIKSIQEKKNLQENIPVSCFTATAKQKVIEDIRFYFKEKLAIDLEIFTSKASRTNLHYKVFERREEDKKYNTVRDLLDEKNCPAIIYVSRTRKAYLLAEKLNKDGYNAKPYHGKMDVKEKTENQNAFVSGDVQIMVATSAFGMGVDKKDVGMVIHYEISDSLENYIQEAGRAGRDENITANCYVLFNEEDLSKHFILLNQTKLNISEIKQIWNAIKFITKFRSTVSNSALEIARKAGWDDNVAEIETRVTTAIAALEEAGYLKRGQNMPRVFANSILTKTAQEAIDKINRSIKLEESQKEKAIRIIKKLFSSKSRKESNDEDSETRIDYIADRLSIVKDEVISIINLLREEKILADTKDLTAFIKRGENVNRSLVILNEFGQIENFFLSQLEEREKVFHLKELNEVAEQNGCSNVTPHKIKTIITFWAIKNWIKQHYLEYSKNHLSIISLQPYNVLKDRLNMRHGLAQFIVGYLHKLGTTANAKDEIGKEEVLVEFSVHELKEKFESHQLFVTKTTIEDIEDTLFYLSRIDAIKIEGGFMVMYNRLTINRVEQNNQIQYKKEDYQKLNQFYESKVQQIHIVGEFAKKMIEDYTKALKFVEDYFQLSYSMFLNTYFPGSRQSEIKRNITPSKFRELFGSLSTTQLNIIKDSQAKYIVVAAGPGSGKTKVLVHKLASLLLMEDVKHEQLLMITFSRAAATEFKKRLLKLIGNAANYIEIKTFHSYCFDLLGKVGNLEKSNAILKRTIEKIKNGEVEVNRITKTVIVIDEAQDMDADEFELINVLIEKNEEMRVIAVGDDDQNIYSFRGADVKYMEQLITVKNASKYELIDNYRSKNNLVEFTNQFAGTITHRLKSTLITAKQKDNGLLKIVQYSSGNLITPLIRDLLSTRFVGTIGVLTKTNDEASQITGLLLKHGLQAKLIQSSDGFNLYNLLEIRFFLDLLKSGDNSFIVSDEQWAKAKKELATTFIQSSKLEICNNVIKDFEAIYPKKKYKSDLEVFINESKFEDFFNENGEIIFVSTIHKAKGKEFDNVILLLDNVSPDTDDIRRQLYVAMTRAKQNLTIHLNGDYLNNIVVENLVKIEDENHYTPPNELAMHLTYKDVWLDYFKNRQELISRLKSGESLRIDGDECKTATGNSILKFSKLFLTKIDSLKQKGYNLKSARVNLILYWRKEESEREIKILFPEVYFERSNSQPKVAQE
jgi:ATP-dependent DNA helicase RecQ